MKRALEELQNDDSGSQDELVEMTRKLKEANREEELFWQQRCRVLWTKEGDNNSKFFHAQTKQRRARNRLIGLYNTSGVWVDEDYEVEEVAVDYFQDIFSSTSLSDIEEVLREVHTLVSDQTNRVFTALAIEEEVR